MCALELDPTICQALRLLHSSSSDSTDQLRSALDELKYLDTGREKEKEREKEKDTDLVEECHSPIISDTDAESAWQCVTCLDALDFDNASSINSPPMVIECSSSSTASGPISPEKANSVSPPPQIPLDELPTPPKVVTPTINIISGDQRLQIVKKKSNKHRENKRNNTK
ncbi:uncharacterized protein LOC143922656 [Arctopsyche grandis]|uniref:uncharacterized protein LOC143922656 n=1 Tax=Arctopsyche grandis TaxID=121162 RepID=UPI00406D6DF9